MATGQIKRRNPLLAAIATLGVTGLGQLYNGKPRKAAIFYLLWLAIAGFMIVAPLSSGISWLIVTVSLSILLCLAAIIDAVRDARSIREIGLHRYNRWYVYLTIILIQGLLVIPLEVVLLKTSNAAYRITTASMAPTLDNGDRILADMKAYRKHLPVRGDLVIFKYPMNESVHYVKRVIGLPGETVEIKGRTVYVNSEPLEETYVLHLDPASTHDHWGPYKISAESYFVLGDSRDNSQDSRFWGPVKQSQILGKARYLYWAKDLNRIGRMVK